MLACILSAAAYLSNTVFRQYIRYMNAGVLILGLIAVLIIWHRDISPDDRRKRIAARVLLILVIFLGVIGVLLQVLLGTDMETAVDTEEGRKIRIVRQGFMMYEVEYHEYGNILWYGKYPYIRESYDDGDPNQYVYTDYYDENGDLIGRVFAGE